MKIAYIGGGSILWGFYVVRQLINSQHLLGTNLTLTDIDPEALELNRQACSIYNSHKGSPIDIHATDDLNATLDNADFVIVAISTGSLDAMQHDLAIPERYGIFHTVGDTVGPAGWARAMRSIPVFHDFGRRMKELCPNAWMLNVSNPLTVLTRVPHRYFGIKTAGICHSLDNTARALATLAGADKNPEPDYISTGIDHGSFFLKLFSDGIDVLAELERRGFRRNDGILPDSAAVSDAHAEASHLRVACALWHELGYMPAISDRHLIENYPWYVTQTNTDLSFNTKRTSIQERWQWRNNRQQQIKDYINDGSKDLFHEFEEAHDPICEIIESLAGFRSYIAGTNYRNIGQMPDAPQDAVVETRCRFDHAGIHPMCSPLPNVLKPIVLPTIHRQESMVETAISGTFDDLVALVMTDPLCSRISPTDCRKMMRELLEANRQYLPHPQFLPDEKPTTIRKPLPITQKHRTVGLAEPPSTKKRQPATK